MVQLGSGLGNLSTKTGLETGFLSKNLDRLQTGSLGRRNLDRKRPKTGTETGFQAGQGLASAACPISKAVSCPVGLSGPVSGPLPLFCFPV
jgi:hypothetical protein